MTLAREAIAARLEAAGYVADRELAMALWSVILLAVCVPLALRRFNRTLAA